MNSVKFLTSALVAVACLFSILPTTAQAKTTSCIIASNDGRNGFRTDEVSQCRVDTLNGNASFVFNGKNRQRSYVSVKPLTKRHLQAATYWLKRTKRLRVPARTNPAKFDPQKFLNEAAQATDGFVLVHNRKGGRALNVVYITNGVYRSIDFPGTNLRETPTGFLTTAR